MAALIAVAGAPLLLVLLLVLLFYIVVFHTIEDSTHAPFTADDFHRLSLS